MAVLTKRKRRSSAEIRYIKDEIYRFCEEEQPEPLNLRNIFYRCVTLKLVEKNENEYARIG